MILVLERAIGGSERVFCLSFRDLSESFGRYVGYNFSDMGEASWIGEAESREEDS